MPDTTAPDTPAEEVRATVTVRAFLTIRPVECIAAPSMDAERGLMLSAQDTTGTLGARFSARWLGAEAVKFLADHQAELKPGRCLDLQLYNIRPHDGGLRARIHACQLAPLAPSWVKHEEKLSQSTTPESQSA